MKTDEEKRVLRGQIRNKIQAIGFLQSLSDKDLDALDNAINVYYLAFRPVQIDAEVAGIEAKKSELLSEKSSLMASNPPEI